MKRVREGEEAPEASPEGPVSRGASWTRRVLWVFGGLVGFVLLCVAIVLIGVHTDRGREFVRKQLVHQLRGVLRGDLAVDRIEGSLLSQFSIVGVKVWDRDRHEAISIGRVDVGYRLLGLWNKTVQVDQLRVTDLDVSARQNEQQELNLAQLFPGSQEDEEASDWAVAVSSIQLDNATVRYSDESTTVVAKDIVLESNLSHRPDQTMIAIQRLAAKVSDVPVSLVGSAQLSSAGTRVDDFRLQVDEAVLRLATFAIRPDGHVRGQAAVSVPATAVRRIDPTSKLLADVVLSFSIDRPSQEAPVVVAASGTVGASPVSLHGEFAPQSAASKVHFAVRKLDVSRVWQGLVSSDLTLELDASSVGKSVDRLTGSAVLTVDGRLDKTNLGALQLQAAIEHGIATARIAPKSGPRWIDARATVQLADRTLQSASLRFDHPRVESLVFAYLDLAGDLTLSANASGNLDNLSVAGSITSSQISALGNRVRKLRANWQGRLGKGSYAGKLHVEAGAILMDGTPLGSLSARVASDRVNRFRVEIRSQGLRKSHRIDLETDVLVGKDSTRIDLNTVILASRGLTWRAGGGSVVVGTGNKVSVHDVAFRSRAGHVKIDGDFVVDRGFTGGELDVRAKNLDLAEWSSALKLATPLEGKVTMNARIAKQGRKRAHAGVDVQFAAVRAGNRMPATTGSIGLHLRHRTITLDATFKPQGVGSLEVKATASAPRRPFAFNGWSNLHERMLTSAEIVAQDWNMQAFAPLDERLPRSGTVGLRGMIGPGGKTAQWTVTGRDLLLERLGEPAHGRIKVEIDGREVVLEGKAGVGKRGAATVHADASLTGSWLKLQTWSKGKREHFRGAHVGVSDVDVDWWLRTLDLTSDAYGAWASVEVVLDKGFRKAVATMDVRQPKGGPRSNTAATHSRMVATIADKHVHLDWNSSVGKKEVIVASAQLARGWQTLVGEGVAGLRNGDVRADVEIRNFPLVALQDAFSSVDVRRMTVPRGSLVASANLRGTLADPVVSVRAHTQDAVLAGTEFLDFRLEGDYRQRQIRAKLLGKQRPGGALHLDAGVKLAPSPIVDARIHAKQWDIGFIKHVAPERLVAGIVTADIRAKGPIDKPAVVGTAQLRGGTFRPGSPLYVLSNVNLDTKLLPTALRIKGTSASGRGKMKLRGTVAMRDLAPQSLRLDLQLRDWPVEAGPQSVLVDTRTAVRGKKQASKWDMRVNIGDTLVSVPGRRARTLHEDELPQDIVFVDSARKTDPTAGALLRKPSSSVVVRIKAPETISIRGEQVRTRMGVDLRLKLSDAVALQGNIATHGGWVELFGRRYELSRGEVVFDGPVDPNLNVKLTHDFSAMTLIVAVTGTGMAPQLDLRSNPARYDNSELLSFVLGASPDDSRSAEQSAGSRATGVASTLLASRLQSVVRDIVPIDVLKIDLADDEAAAEKLTVGKWLTKKTFFAYRRHFEAKELENTNEAIIEYRFMRRWLLETYYGDQGAGGADLLWIRRF